jgi:Zn ribbon nucleic-acid-binding protein
MNFQCPQCKSKDTKTVQTLVDCIQCECLNCKHKFDREPTVQERDAFNN